MDQRDARREVAGEMAAHARERAARAVLAYPGLGQGDRQRMRQAWERLAREMETRAGRPAAPPPVDPAQMSITDIID